MHLNYHHLFYFYTIAKQKSFTRASEVLHLQQPSLSAQIKTLEDNFGFRLLRREKRGVGLTSQGDVVFRYCQRIFDAGKDLESYLKREPTQKKSILRIGVSKQLDPTFISDIFSHFMIQKDLRHLRLRVVAGQKDELLQDMRDQNLDVVLANTSGQSTTSADLLAVQLPVGLFVSTRGWKKSRRDLTTRQNLKNFLQSSNLELVQATEKLSLRHETEAFLSKTGVSLPTIFESDLLPVVARAVMEGIGAGFLPIAYMKEEMDLGLVINIAQNKSLWSQKLFLIGPHLTSTSETPQEIKILKESLFKAAHR